MYNFKLFLTIALINTAIIGSVRAGDGRDDNARTIYVESVKYALPLLEKWVTEYNKTNPDTRIEWAAKNAENIDLRIVADVVTDNGNEDDEQTVIYVGRSALLPVTTKENPLYEQIAKKKFGKKELKRLFFIDDRFDDDEPPSKDRFQEQLTVYSGSGRTSGAALFASYFGLNISDFRGKKIQGDDIYLLQAIGKDPTGVTFNNLSYIYDLNDRQLKDNIALLPLNIKRDQLEVIRSENLDQTISLLENEKVESVPVLNIGFACVERVEVRQFLKWIVTEGQRFNHEFGFLQVDEKTLAVQKNILDDRLLTNK